MFAAIKCLLVFIILLSTNQLKSQNSSPVITLFSPNLLPQGYTTIIEGQNFSGATAVYFDDTIPASFTVISDTQIRTVVPRNAKGGFVRVTTPAGTAMSSKAFVITRAPYIDSFSPIKGSPGTVVTMKGFNFTGVKTVNVYGVSMTSVTVVSDSTLTFAVGSNFISDLKGPILVSYTDSYSGRPSTDSFTCLYIPPPPTISSFSPKTGTEGTKVTIWGTNFMYVTAVTVGGTPVSSYKLVYNGGESIEAILAAGRNSGAVSVTTRGGTASLDGFNPGNKPPHVISFSPVSAINGNATQVTIKGYNFTGATQVSFGSVPANSFSVLSDTMITAEVFSSSTGFVKVTTPDGSDSLGGFTAIPNAPHITSFTPSSGGAGTVVTIKGERFVNISSVTFGGTPAISFTITSDTTITAQVGLGSSGPVKVANPGGNDSLGSFTFVPTPPVITSFYDLIPQGFTTTIFGKHFTGATSVKFDDVIPASFTVISDTVIKAVVPRNAQGGFVMVNTPAGSARSAKAFVITRAPYIDSFTPIAGTSGTVVTMKGFNFTGIKAVKIYGVSAAYVTVISDSTLQFVMGHNSGGSLTGPISVYTNDDMVPARNSTDSFAYKYTSTPVPSIWSFTPTTGTLGTTVTINGFFLTGATAVTIGGTPAASFTVVSSTTIQAVLAAGTNSGSISVTTPGGSTSLGGFIYTGPNLVPPHISSFTPSSATPGTMVAIKGINLTGATAVSFGGTPATSFTVTSDSTISAQVGLGSSGLVKITNPGGSDSLGTFTYVPLPPVITLFNPDLLPQGYTTLIEGQYFSGATAVYFDDTIPASFTVISDTQIKTVVPRNAKGGFVKVTTPAGTARSSKAFVITRAPYIDSFSPKTGTGTTVVTINGFNFTGVKNVSLYGINAASVTVISDSTLQFTMGSSYPWDIKGPLTVSYDQFGASRTTADSFAYFYIPPPPVISSFTPTNGTQGTKITISGTYFTYTTAVSIGGIPAASFNLLSDGIIEAVVAPGTTSGKVSVTTRGGTVSADGFNYNNNNAKPPHIISFTPTNATSGALITIKGYNLTGATAVSFGGTPSSLFTVTSDSSITAQLASGASGFVKVVTPNGVDSLGTFTYTITPVTVPAPDVVSFLPASGTSGTIITIKGIHFANVTAVNFGGTPAASFTIISDSTINAIVGSGATGVVEVVTTNGRDTLGGFTYNSGIITTPNPATGFIVVEHPVSINNSQIKVTSSMGKILENIRISPNTSQTRINLTGVAPGIYVIRWSDGSNSYSKTVFVK